MATYYVRKTGSDAAAGTSPAAAWLTIGKALGAAGIASGDTVYVGAGTYREAVTVAMTSATVETKVIADTDGSQTGDSGQVVWTAYTTNDKTASSASSLLNLNGKAFLTFNGFVMVAGNAVGINSSTSATHDIKFTDCTMIQGHLMTGALITATAAFATALNWTFDRCCFVACGGNTLQFTLTTGVGADYDANVVFQNSVFLGAANPYIFVTNSGTAANKGGGVKVRNSTFLGRGSLINTTAAQTSTTVPCTVANCALLTGSGVALNAGTSGQITENYNVIAASTARTNVTAGANSISDGSYAPLLEVGQAVKAGATVRALFMPMAGSPLLGYGDDGTAPAVDYLNMPRPAGGGSGLKAVGALERQNSWGRETTTVRTGSNALSITGPGTQDFQLAVDAVSTTVSVYLRYDSTYAGTRPQMQVVNGGEAGVADATVTASVAALNAFEQNSLTFTPTSAGIVTIRLLSNDTNGSGKAFADDFNVT